MAMGRASLRLCRRRIGHREERRLLPEDAAVVRLSRVAPRPVGAMAHAATEGMGGTPRRAAARRILRDAGSPLRVGGRARALRAAHAVAPGPARRAGARKP